MTLCEKNKKDPLGQKDMASQGTRLGMGSSAPAPWAERLGGQ